MASTLDMLPMLAAIAGGDVPGDRIIDGDDISGLIHGETEHIAPARAFYYYQRTRLRAVRVGRWKLHLLHAADKEWGRHIAAEDNIDIDAPLLFDLETDVGERNNVAHKKPEVVARLLKQAEKAREDIGDYDRVGAGARFFDPEPRRPDLHLANIRR